MDSYSSHLHVVPSLDRGWVVRESADGPAVRRTLTRRGALDVALTMARRQGGRVSTHAVDGTVTAQVEVRALGQRPWWYRQAGSPFLGHLVTLCVATIFLFRTLPGLPRWLPVLMAVLSLFVVCSIIGSRWLDRREGPIVRLAAGAPRADDRRR